MISLLLAILTSAMIAVIMRLSSDKVSGRTGMLAVNYFVCLALAALHTGISQLVPADPGVPAAMGLGFVNGFLFLAGFVLLQSNTKRNGVVLSSIFMKLGLLVPMVISILFFREMPTVVQILGFCAAIVAIILINYEKGGKAGSRWSLLLLLLAGGSCDAMAKILRRLVPHLFPLSSCSTPLWWHLRCVLALRHGRRSPSGSRSCCSVWCWASLISTPPGSCWHP